MVARYSSCLAGILHRLWACNNSNLHMVQAGNFGAVDGGQLPRLLVVDAPRANQVTSQAVSQFWPSCISGTSHTPCWEVPSALLPVCSTVSPAYKNFSCSPSFFSSSFLFSFLVFCLIHQSKSQVSSQVRSRLLNQLDLSSALPLSCHTTKDLPNYNTLHQAMFMSLSCLNNQTKPCQLLEMTSSFTTCLQSSCKFKLLTLLPSPSPNTLLT